METNEAPKRKTWLWVLGWIFFFPAPLMVLVWRKKSKLPIWAKIVITAVTCIFVFAVGGGGSSDSTKAPEPATIVDGSEEVEDKKEQEVEEAVVEEEPVIEEVEEESIEEEPSTLTVEQIAPLVGLILEDNFGKDNYKVDTDEAGVTVSVWGEGVTLGALYAAAGEENNVASWKNMKENCGKMSTSIYNTIKETTQDEDVIVVVNVLNENNLENTLLSYLNGICIYDCVEE